MAGTDSKPVISATPPSLLLLVLDLHPLSWSLLSQLPTAQPPSNAPPSSSTARAPFTNLSLQDFINVLLVFLNAHLASRWGNEVAVYGATAGRSKMLYPLAPEDQNQAGPSKPRPNTFQPFQMLNSNLQDSLRSMAQEEERRLQAGEMEGLNEPPAIVSALTKALCHINRSSPSTSHSSSLTASSDPDAAAAANPDRLEPRIMIVNATPGSSSSDGQAQAGEGKGKMQMASGGMRGGYVGLMNCVFAAQKAKVPIDVLSLPPPTTGTSAPIFLQQAAHLTDGVYWRWNGRGGLLQYFHTIYLSPPSLRRTAFAVPPQDAVDYRAVCFCHGDVVDVGFVCSVCLSIFCKPLPVCQMCKTKFPIKAIPILRAMAENIQPVPIPDTIPPPIKRPDSTGGGRKGKDKDAAGAKAPTGSRAAPMEVE